MRSQQFYRLVFSTLIIVLGFGIYLISTPLFRHNFDLPLGFAGQAATPSLLELPYCDDHNPGIWHPPVKKSASGKIICAYGHEHGDPPPKWVTDAGFNPGFDHISGFHANTSEIENTLKHPGMKGFAGRIKDVEIYARIHLMSNPLDRAARFHSYELFLKDQTGAVSHFQGWLNTGDPVIDRTAYQDKSLGSAGVDSRKRPVLWATTQHACEVDQLWCRELWSMTTSSWGPEIVWGINDSTTYFQPGEKYDPDISHWQVTGKFGGERSISLTIFRNPENLKKRGQDLVPAGKIWATQFGEIVSGLDDPRCFQMTNKYGTDYPNICLENCIAPTLPQITGLDNTLIRKFDVSGVKIPN